MRLLRSISVPILLFIGAVFTITANTTVWANRTVFNEDNFVETTNRVLDEEAVQEQLATRLSAELVAQGQVQDRLNERLPEGLQVLAPVLTNTATNVAYDIILRLLQNDTVRAALDRSIRLVHSQIMRIVEGEGAIVVEGDAVILDLRVVLERAAEEFDLGNGQLLERVELPEDAGQIVLVEDAQTADTVQDLLSLHDQVTWIVIGVALLAFAFALLAARNRPATLRTIGAVIVICGLLAVTILFPLRPIAAGFAQNDTAARAAFDAFFYDYRLQSFLLILLGGVVLLIGVLAGDGEMATAVRGSVRRKPGEPAPDMGGLIQNHATALRLLGFVAGAVVLAAWPEPTTRVYVTMFILLAAYFAFLWAVTSKSERAGKIRQQASTAFGASPGDDNASFFGRHANLLRVAGIVVALGFVILTPNLGIGAIAAIVACTFAYLALVEWLSTRQA